MWVFRLSIVLAVFCMSMRTGFSQEIAVASFNLLENDMTARSFAPVRDANGDLTALVKVVTTAKGFDFDGGSLGVVKVDHQPGEIWVYVPPGARMITLRHPQLGVLRNYAYPVSISGGSVYEMVLAHGEMEVIVKERQLLTEFVIIDSEPPNADVYLNNELVGKTPFSSAFPEGRYEWRVAREMHLPEAGVFELKAGEKQRITLKLKPNFGSVQLKSLPENGASVTLNGVKLGKSTPCTLTEVPAGEHKLVLTHEWYETTTRNVVVSPGLTEVLEVAMEPNFAELTVSAQSDEDVYINGARKGKGTFTSRLAPGVYAVEVRKPGHKPATQQLRLKRGDKENLALRLDPILSSLQVVSEPIDAEIYLDGKLVGTTPHILRNLVVGGYEIELRLKGYATEIQMIEVKDGEVVEVVEILRKGFEFEPEMVFVEGGKFTKGCSNVKDGNCGEDEKPAHEVVVDDFQISKYEITQATWQAVMQANPSHFIGCHDCPVENVTWNEVQAFLVRLNLLTGKKYRLPTESEWEFAARGGNATKEHSFAGSNDIDDVAWYSANSGNTTHPVGQKQPNELGLYDMSGNVWEWCEDLYSNYNDIQESVINGGAGLKPRVLRGGSWDRYPRSCRTLTRFYAKPDNRNINRGFRVVLSTSE